MPARTAASHARRGRTRRPSTRLNLAALALAAAALLPACGDAESAVARGDRLWADSSFDAALAEYRLALRQSGSDERILLRVAHAYVRAGQLERAREIYDRLLARDREYEDQAVYDYLRMAHRALERGDRYGLAGAVEAALALRRDLQVGELAAPLARYYAGSGDPARALEFYERALAASPQDSAARMLHELGLIHQAVGNCDEAIGYFEAYLQREPEGERAGEARWHTGGCAFELARAAHQEGKLLDALDHVATVIELGVPENIQDQAWFERGEILFVLGRFDEALAAYRRVLDLNPARTGQLVERAQRRIDQIRFGS